MLGGLCKASLIEKAWQQPDKVRMVLEKMARTLVAKHRRRRNKLDHPRARILNAGVVIELGEGVTGFKAVTVSRRMAGTRRWCACLRTVRENSDAVPDDAAAFAWLGAIALHGIRRAAADPGGGVRGRRLGTRRFDDRSMLRAQGCACWVRTSIVTGLHWRSNLAQKRLISSRTWIRLRRRWLSRWGAGVDGV